MRRKLAILALLTALCPAYFLGKHNADRWWQKRSQTITVEMPCGEMTAERWLSLVHTVSMAVGGGAQTINFEDCSEDETHVMMKPGNQLILGPMDWSGGRKPKIDRAEDGQGVMHDNSTFSITPLGQCVIEAAISSDELRMRCPGGKLGLKDVGRKMTFQEIPSMAPSEGLLK